MTHYLFHEPGSIPGVPGTFAHCLVELPDDGSEPIITPLLQQPHVLEETEVPPELPAAESVAPLEESAPSAPEPVLGETPAEPPAPEPEPEPTPSESEPEAPPDEAPAASEPEPVVEASTPESEEGEA